MRFQDLQALVIHVRPYRETSAIVRYFTRQQGLLSVVMRGIKRGRRPTRIQPFATGTLACSGRGTLLTGISFEPGRMFSLTGNGLSAGFYVLELIDRLLSHQQGDEEIFAATLKGLAQLQEGLEIAEILRSYELILLQNLGYGLDFLHDAQSGEQVADSGSYEYISEQGFSLTSAAADNDGVFSGRVLRSIGARDFSSAEVRRAARVINGKSLAPLLGPRPLISRQLWEPGADGGSGGRS